MVVEKCSEEKDPKTEKAKEILKKVNIQSQPKILIEINRLARSEDVSFDLVADLVSQDVGMSAKVLKLASSPIYSKGQKFNSVHEALMAIGFDEFRSCMTSVTLEDFLGKIGYPYSGFWEHSRRVAVFCRVLASKLQRRYENNAYTLGLFHDVGAIIIPLYNRNYVEHIHRAMPLFFGITDLEFKLVSTNHCAVGEIFGRNWGLSEDILTALRYHHRPDMNPPEKKGSIVLKAILQLAELFNDKILSKDSRLTPFAQSKEVLAKCCELFDLKPDDLNTLENELITAV